jgi:hypothetical protein
MHITLDDGRTVVVAGTVARLVATLVDLAPELPAGGYKLTLDVGRDGAIRPGLQRSWPERKAPAMVR